MRTTCVGGRVLLNFTFAKSQSRPIPTASHPRHPSRSSRTLFASPFYHPGLAHGHGFLSLPSPTSLFLPYLSFSLFFPSFPLSVESEFAPLFASSRLLHALPFRFSPPTITFATISFTHWVYLARRRFRSTVLLERGKMPAEVTAACRTQGVSDLCYFPFIFWSQF